MIFISLIDVFWVVVLGVREINKKNLIKFLFLGRSLFFGRCFTLII